MENNQEAVKSNNFLVYILLFCIVLLVGIVGVILAQYEIISKDELQSKYVQKTDISFESLPSYIKDEYIEKHRCNTNTETKTVEVEKIVTETKTVEIEKEVAVEKIVEVEKVVEKLVSEDIFAKENYKVAKCYDMSSGTPWLSKKCKSSIEKFLEVNKDAKYFEVIGVVSNDDFVLLNKLKRNQDVLEKLNVTKKKISRLQTNAVVGLSKKRVEETSWFIKKTLGMDTKVLPVNYHITSKKNNKGTVVRVYY
jgi:ribosomal protein L17